MSNKIKPRYYPSAMEYDEMLKKDYPKIRKEYEERSKDWHFVKSWMIIIIIGIAAFLFIKSKNNYIKYPSVIMGVFCFGILSKREGELEGYVLGYEDGQYEGVNKSLGLSDEQSQELLKTASELKVEQIKDSNSKE